MEKWEKKFILENQHNLISNTFCTTLLIAKLGQEGVLSESHVAELNNSVIDDFTRSLRLYQILLTKSNGYQILLDALREDNQTGAVNILEGIKNLTSLKNLYGTPSSPSSSGSQRAPENVVTDGVSDEQNEESEIHPEGDTLPFIKRNGTSIPIWKWKYILTFIIAITAIVAFIVGVAIYIELHPHANPEPKPTTNSTPSPTTKYTDPQTFSSPTPTTAVTSSAPAKSTPTPPTPSKNLKLVGLLLGPVGNQGVLELITNMFGSDTCVKTNSPSTGPTNLVSYEIKGLEGSSDLASAGKECDNSKVLIVVDIPLFDGEEDTKEISYSDVLAYLETLCQPGSNCSAIFIMSVVSSLYEAFQDGRWDPDIVKTFVSSLKADKKIEVLNKKTFIQENPQGYWAAEFEKITVIPLLTCPAVLLIPVSTPSFTKGKGQAMTWSYLKEQLFET